MEQKIDGFAGSLLSETILGTPTTAHILGGACMGTTAEEGVIDDRHRVFGYDGLYVIDGAAMSANPGVNPSLTITALAERAMSFIPAKEGQPKNVRTIPSSVPSSSPSSRAGEARRGIPSAYASAHRSCGGDSSPSARLGMTGLHEPQVAYASFAAPRRLGMTGLR